MAAKPIELMNDQIHLDRDAVKAYEEAIKACENAEIRKNLSVFQGDHERHVRELSLCVREYGGTPAEHTDIKGFFIAGFTKVASRGDRSALLAMLGNEELTNRSYEAALEHDLPDDVQALFRRNLSDERRHLAWIKEAIQTLF
jgi:uncharacterized protein (TIGR02284 family)